MLASGSLLTRMRSASAPSCTTLCAAAQAAPLARSATAAVMTFGR
jgi:hypothetical protein